MTDAPETPLVTIEPPTEKGEKKKKKKEAKLDITRDKLELSLYRGQVAMVRTAATTTTLGFALYKLLEEKTHDGLNRPILHVFTPRMVALFLFLSGFVGLFTYCFRHAASLRKIGRFTPRFYFTGVMLVSYIILLLTFMLFLGTLFNE